jgi:hypothetical protein
LTVPEIVGMKPYDSITEYSRVKVAMKNKFIADKRTEVWVHVVYPESNPPKITCLTADYAAEWICKGFAVEATDEEITAEKARDDERAAKQRQAAFDKKVPLRVEVVSVAGAPVEAKLSSGAGAKRG